MPSRDVGLTRVFPSSFGECIPPSCCISEKKCVAVMADYSSVAPPSSNAGGGMNDAFKDALQRARQVIVQLLQNNYICFKVRVLGQQSGFFWFLFILMVLRRAKLH